MNIFEKETLASKSATRRVPLEVLDVLQWPNTFTHNYSGHIASGCDVHRGHTSRTPEPGCGNDHEPANFQIPHRAVLWPRRGWRQQTESGRDKCAVGYGF